MLLHELGRKPHDASLLLALALEIQLHGHFARTLDDRLLACTRRNLALGRFIIEELQQLAKADIHNYRDGWAYLARLRHGQAEEGSLALLAARLALVEHLEGLHSSRSAEAPLIGGIVVVIYVRLLVLLDGIFILCQL